MVWSKYKYSSSNSKYKYQHENTKKECQGMNCIRKCVDSFWFFVLFLQFFQIKLYFIINYDQHMTQEFLQNLFLYHWKSVPLRNRSSFLLSLRSWQALPCSVHLWWIDKEKKKFLFLLKGQIWTNTKVICLINSNFKSSKPKLLIIK
jgi:hypothetical protein